MRPLLALLLALAASCARQPTKEAIREAAPSAPATAEPARAVPAPPHDAAPLGPIPGDVTLKAQRAPDGWQVRVGRKKHLVALRQGAAHATGDGAATLAITGGAAADPVVWEATDPVTMLTTRGRIALDGEAPRLEAAEAPALVATETQRRHACRAHDDGAGGFTVICRVRDFAGAVNVTRGAPRDGVWTAANIQQTLVRAELTPGPTGADAVVIGYADGTTGVVVRAEASRVEGEERAALVIQSEARAQPEVIHLMKPPPRHHRPPRPDPEIDLF